MSSSDDTATDAPADAPDEEVEEVETDEFRDGLVERFRTELGDAVVGSHVKAGREVWVRVTREAWVEAGLVLRDRLGCKHFTFLSAIDWLPSPYGRYQDAEVDKLVHGEEPKDLPPMEAGYAGGDTRFQVFARAANIAAEQFFGVTLKADLPDDDLTVDSWIPVFAGADWHEREAWEMYGITFRGHPYLRHIYLPGDFEGHPLRKDFPLLARVVKPWPGIVDVEPMPGDDEPADGEGGDDA